MPRSLPPNWPNLHVQIPPTCEHCSGETVYVDSVPDARIQGTHPSECGYRLSPLCWLHGAERRLVATSRLQEVFLVGEPPHQVGFIDRDRAGGDCLCDHCGRKYYDHPQLSAAPYLNQLCDGSLVKL